MKKIIAIILPILLTCHLFAKPKEPSQKQKAELTSYIKNAFENEFDYSSYSYDTQNKSAQYIYFENDLTEDDVLTIQLTDAQLYHLTDISFSKFEKLSKKDSENFLNENYNLNTPLSEDIKKNINHIKVKEKINSIKRTKTNTSTLNTVYCFYDVNFKFKNYADTEKTYSTKNLYIWLKDTAETSFGNFYLLNTDWIDINITFTHDIYKGFYLFSRDKYGSNFITSFTLLKAKVESEKPRGIEKEVFDFYGSYKMYTTSYVYESSRKSSLDLDDMEILIFDIFDFSYKLEKGYNSYIIDSNDSYISYEGKMPTLESDSLRYIIEDKANVIQEEKTRKNTFQNGTYYESMYKFDTSKFFLLKATKKTQAVEMLIGKEKYYPIYETILIDEKSPLFNKREELKNYRHKAR